MTRSWKSQIADEVRATSMMKPKWPEDAMVHIASLQEDNDRLRNLLSEAEKREREARAKALEEAANMADEMPLLRPISTAHVKTNTPKDVAAAIRAMQSEER